MKWNKFYTHWDSTRQANILLVAYSAIITLGIILLIGQVVSMRERVVLVPPYINQQMKVGYASADPSFYESWGMYVAELTGNLTPGNEKYVRHTLRKLLAPKPYQAVNTAILATVAQEKTDKVVTAFVAQRTIWQPQTKTVFVYGTLHQISPAGRYVASSTQTYQMNFQINHGQPVITAMSWYPGVPHTIRWYEHHEPSISK